MNNYVLSKKSKKRSKKDHGQGVALTQTTLLLSPSMRKNMYVINLNLKVRRNTVTTPKDNHNLQVHTTLFRLINNSYSLQDKVSSFGNWKSKAKNHNHNKKLDSNQRPCYLIQIWIYSSNKTSHAKFYLLDQFQSNFPQEASIIFLVILELLQKLSLFKTKEIVSLNLITLMMLL